MKILFGSHSEGKMAKNNLPFLAECHGGKSFVGQRSPWLSFAVLVPMAMVSAESRMIGASFGWFSSRTTRAEPERTA